MTERRMPWSDDQMHPLSQFSCRCLVYIHLSLYSPYKRVSRLTLLSFILMLNNTLDRINIAGLKDPLMTNGFLRIANSLVRMGGAISLC